MAGKKSTYDILVTGGAGFIGSHLVHQLLSQHENVIILDDLSGGFIENISPKAHFIRGSITDEQLIRRIFKDYNIKYIFHLAAYAAEGLSHFIRRFNYTNNVTGCLE